MLYTLYFTDSTAVAALVTLPMLLKENTSEYFNVDRATPTILPMIQLNELLNVLDEENSFKVVVEGNKICETGDFLHAYTVMFAAYYVFNLAYPVKLEGTFSFIQKFILKIGDKVKTKPKVLTLIAKVNNKMV